MFQQNNTLQSDKIDMFSFGLLNNYNVSENDR